MKKVLSLVLAFTMVVALAACGGGTSSSEAPAPASTAGENAPESTGAEEPGEEGGEEAPTPSGETIKIGVVLYDPGDAEFLALKDYFDNYVGPGMNIEFMYSEAIADADGEIAFINNCAASGCVAVMGYYNVTGIEAAWTAIDAGMYYTFALHTYDGYDELAGEEKFLGGIDYGSNGDWEAGNAMGTYLASLGVSKVAFSNGGADMGVPMFVNRQQGFLDGIGDAEVYTVSGFPGSDAFASAQSGALTEPGIEAVATSFNALGTWVQPLATAGLDVPVVSIGAVTADFVGAMENGQLDMLVAANIQRYALQVATVYQAVNGNVIRGEDGNAPIYSQSYWTITSAEDCATLLDIQENDRVYTVEELLSVTSYDRLIELTDSYSLEDIQARRA